MADALVARTTALPRTLARLARQPRALLARWWRCPCCGWRGPFLPFNGRPHSRCPACLALERHRLQRLVVAQLWAGDAPRRVLHVAPEEVIGDYLRRRGCQVAGMDMRGWHVDLWGDLRSLPMAAATFDLVYASHVLEHIREDRAALAEIHRVLRPGGSAILPVPIAGPTTVEYSAPRPEEHGHVRSPGMDYLERIAAAGFSVARFASADFPADRYQLRVYPPGGGSPYDELVPLCRRK